MGGYSSLFVAAPISSAPVMDPYIPITPPILDPSGGLFGGILGSLGGFLPSVPSAPISGFSPIQTAPSGGGTVIQMPTPVAGKCLLGHGHRRMNWANFRALNRANRRLHAFNKHARRYIKITRKVKTPKRRKRS